MDGGEWQVGGIKWWRDCSKYLLARSYPGLKARNLLQCFFLVLRQLLIKPPSWTFQQGTTLSYMAICRTISFFKLRKCSIRPPFVKMLTIGSLLLHSARWLRFRIHLSIFLRSLMPPTEDLIVSKNQHTYKKTFLF